VAIRAWEAHAVSTLALALLIILAVATCTFYVAGVHGYGSPWARDVCSLSQDLCTHPEWSAIATAAAAVLYLVLKALRF
jgi:hypothetical protein